MPYIRASKKIHGPFTPQQLIDLQSRGRLPPDAEFSNTARGPWTKIPSPPNAQQAAVTAQAVAAKQGTIKLWLAVVATFLACCGVCIGTVFVAFPSIIRPESSRTDAIGNAMPVAPARESIPQASPPAVPDAVARGETPTDSAAPASRIASDDVQLDQGPRPEALDAHIAELKRLTEAVRRLAERCKAKDIRAFVLLTLRDLDSTFRVVGRFDDGSLAPRLNAVYDWNSFVDYQGKPKEVTSSVDAFFASSPHSRYKSLRLKTAETERLADAEFQLLWALQGNPPQSEVTEALQSLALRLILSRGGEVKLMRGEVMPGWGWIVAQSGRFQAVDAHDANAGCENTCVRLGEVVAKQCGILDSVLGSLMAEPEEKPAK